jgi:Polyketide cyclase / dehydrase and lipid transport
MSIELSAEIDIAANPADVAAVMFDPQRESEWMQVVTGVELVDQALEPGARVTHRGSVFGREFTWSTEVSAVHFPHVLELVITDGPFSGTMRYDIQRGAAGSRVRIRGAGDVKEIGMLPVSALAASLRAALTADLERLKGIVEKG